MKIDWKHLASTTGYKSLKAAYIKDVQEASKRSRSMRKKDEFLELFNWVICRAKHYAHHTGKTIEQILDEWESKRTYWWLNYYQDCRQPKFKTGSVKAMGVNGLRKYYKRQGYDPETIKSLLQKFNKEAKSRKAKLRWPMRRKKRGY